MVAAYSLFLQCIKHPSHLAQPERPRCPDGMSGWPLGLLRGGIGSTRWADLLVIERDDLTGEASQAVQADVLALRILAQLCHHLGRQLQKRCNILLQK